MKKSRRCFVVALAAAAVPAFAAEPMTISGVWLREGHKLDIMGNLDEKLYYYFSPGGISGTAVGVAAVPDILGGQQVVPFKGTWDFEEIDGKQLFCVYGASLYTTMWAGGKVVLPGQMTYRFYTEGGTEKMELSKVLSNGDGYKEVWTKIGTKLSELPELGVLAGHNMTGGRWWLHRV